MSPKLVDEAILSQGAPAPSITDPLPSPEGRTRDRLAVWSSGMSATVGLALFCIAVQWIRVRDTYFVFDDFLFARIAQLHSYGYSLVTMPLFEHFSPVLWTMQKLMVGPFAMNHGIALTIGLGVSFWAITSLHRLVLRLSGSTLWSAVLALLYGLSVLMTDILRWFTTSVHANLCAAFTLACLLFFVRFRESARRSDAGASVCFMLGALLTHEKSLLIVGYLALLWLVVYAKRYSWRTVIDEIKLHRWLWSAYAVLGVAAAVNFYKNYYLGLPGAAPTEIVLFVVRSFTTSFTPVFFGLRYPEVGGYLGSSVKVAVVVGLIVAVSLTIRRSKGAARGWVFVFTALIVNFAVLGQARVATYGPGSHHGLQYQQEVAFLFPLGLAIVIGQSRSAPRLIRYRPRSSLLAAALVVVAVVYASVLARSNDVVERGFDAGELSRVYIESLDRDAHHFAVNGNAPSVLNSAVPDAWMAAAFVPYNLVSNIAAVMGIPVVAGLHHEGQATYLVTSVGTLQRYDLHDVAALDLKSATPFSGAAVPGEGVCVSIGSEGAYIRIDAPPSVRPAPDDHVPLVLRLGLSASAAASLEVYGGTGSADVRLLSDRAEVPAGTWDYDVLLGDHHFDHLDIHVFDVVEPRTICIDSALLGATSPSP